MLDTNEGKERKEVGFWEDLWRPMLFYFVFQALLTFTGIQKKMDDWAIRKGQEWRERRSNGREERELETLDLEGGVSTVQITEAPNDDTSASNPTSQVAVEALGTTEKEDVIIPIIESQKKIDYGTSSKVSEDSQ
ncbi:hypothetical protein TWF281_002840 [Arthrobotrys megalospora]